MPAIKKDQAVSRITAAIRDLQMEDIADVYNELFPEYPCDATSFRADPRRFQKQIVDHVDKGLEVEEVLDLWRVMFPRDRRVHFNEETNELEYEDQEALYAE